MMTNKRKTHKDFEVWKDGMDLVSEVYSVTKEFPKDELYGLVSQIRRAAVSILANIAEGAARQSRKEFIQYLSISRASLSELEAELSISERLGYISNDKTEGLMKSVRNVGTQLSAIIRTLRNKPRSAKP
jgi:four helix bundle protein